MRAPKQHQCTALVQINLRNATAPALCYYFEHNINKVDIVSEKPFSLFSGDTLRQIAEQASQLLPSEQMRESVQQNIHLVLQNQLGKLDLVSREEFDAQKAVLEKTRAKLEALEKQLAEIIASEQ